MLQRAYWGNIMQISKKCDVKLVIGEAIPRNAFCYLAHSSLESALETFFSH